MFDHIGLGVSNYAASRAFFLKSLAPLGVGIVMEGEHGLGLGPKGKPSLWLFQSSEKPVPLHIAFTAEELQLPLVNDKHASFDAAEDVIRVTDDRFETPAANRSLLGFDKIG